jgi:hypothetical protein
LRIAERFCRLLAVRALQLVARRINAPRIALIAPRSAHRTLVLTAAAFHRDEEMSVPVKKQEANTGPRRIVPTAEFVARGVAPTAGAPVPHLQNHGGPVLGAVEVIPVYWGAAWATGTNAQLASQVDGFFDFILTSSYMDLLNEYSTAATTINHGSRPTSVHVSATEPGTVVAGNRQVTDAQIRTALQAWIANHTVPATTANTLYFIFLPPGVVSLAFNSRSCVAGGYCGYHDHIGGTYYAVIPYADCPGCAFSAPFLDTLTEVASHELAEAITDPALNAWWDPNTGPGDEIGDICNRQTQRLGGYLVQTEWSNTQGACVIAPAPPKWTELDNNLATVETVASGGHLYQRHYDGRIYQYTGPAFTGWTELDNNPATVQIVADANALYQRHNNGRIWVYTGTPHTGWTELDNNPATVDIIASGGPLYQRHYNGRTWQYTG